MWWKSFAPPQQWDRPRQGTKSVLYKSSAMLSTFINSSYIRNFHSCPLMQSTMQMEINWQHPTTIENVKLQPAPLNT
jgi:hypothetical protein